MEESNTTTDLGRRRVLKKIAVGAGFLTTCAVLPERWTRPIVEGITIPAHAATSGESPSAETGTQLTFDQCTLEIHSNNGVTVSWGVEGLLDPPTVGIPIHLVVTAIRTGAGGPDVFEFDTTTVDNITSNYAVGSSFSNGPYSSITAVITSSVATGSTTCSIIVPGG